ncbi:MAG: hypothetical protein OZ932_10235 [Flavobacteriia bacterium]|nr:hypothetical protein [Flavobacteriia bacterium]
MRHRCRKDWFWVWLLAMAFSWGWNELNIHMLREDPVHSVRVSAAGTLVSADDYSYLHPVEQWIAGMPSSGPVLRTPGYGIWYALSRALAPLPKALKVVALLQCALFAASVALFHHALAVQGFAGLGRWAWALLLAVVPMFHGFLFHTLTEGITPSLALAIWACTLCAHGDRGGRWTVIGAMLWAFLVLTRPVLIWVGLPLLVVTWQRAAPGRRWRLPAMLVLLACLPTAVFWVHNAVMNQGPISLHPVYSEDAQGLFRPTHKAFWELAKSWGIRGHEFHQVMVPAFDDAMAGRVDTARAEAFVRTAPAGHLTKAQAALIGTTFMQWQRFTRLRLAPAAAGMAPPLLGVQPEERAIIERLDGITAHYRRDHAFHYHVVVPFQVLWVLVGHSNLSMFVFQHPWRGNPLMEAFRWACAILHLALFCSLLVHLGLRTDVRCRALAFGALLYLGYLAYVQRGVEERYTLPVLFLAVGMAPMLMRTARSHWHAFRSREQALSGP